MNRKTMLVIILLAFGQYNCITDSTAPAPGPGSRNYIWISDTIPSIDTARRIWGSSPSDLWVVSFGDLRHTIYHFDGESWSTDGVYRDISPLSIWGFARDEVYISGQMGEIWHFNGSNWKEFAKLTKDGIKNIAFSHIWGVSSDNFYATGAYGDDQGLINNSVIAHYYNKQWNMINTEGLQGIVSNLYVNKKAHLS